MMNKQPKATGARDLGTNRGTTRVCRKPASLAEAGVAIGAVADGLVMICLHADRRRF
jgi:hypothetical protein